MSEAVFETYSLQLIGPLPETQAADGMLRRSSFAISPALLKEAEENLSDLLPEGFRVEILTWDES